MIRADSPNDGGLRFQLALCTTCGEILEFWYDAIGRQRERCPKCDRRPLCDTGRPQVSQTLLTNAPAHQLRSSLPSLPVVAAGQLRCQGCAAGVEHNGERFCPRCKALPWRQRFAVPVPKPERPAKAPPAERRPIRDETREKMRAIQRAARSRPDYFKPKLCACGVTYTPTSPRQGFHAADCPARS